MEPATTALPRPAAAPPVSPLRGAEFQRTGQRGPDVPEEFGRAHVLEHLRDLTAEELHKGIPRETLEALLRRLQEGPSSPS